MDCFIRWLRDRSVVRASIDKNIVSVLTVVNPRETTMMFVVAVEVELMIPLNGR